MIAIYTPYPTARLKYVLHYLFGQRLGVNWQLKNDQKEDPSDKCRINYSDVLLSGYCNIIPQGLLAEFGVKVRNTEVTDRDGLKVIFKNNGEPGYDIFSAIFFCLSRYEEYFETEKDLHGRFPHTQSFLWKNSCLDIPLVDYWVADLRKILISKYGFNTPDFRHKKFSVLPTIDIDAAFTYKGRSLIRQMAGFAKAATELRVGEIVKRFRVTVTGAKDPNDNFAYQFEQLKNGNLKANYFIQIGAYGKFDKNISASNPAFREIIQSMVKNGHTVGLHPSYASASNYEIIKTEKETLENIIAQPVTDSRQHYLRFSLPKTYQVLIALGMQREFSMGYSEVVGFRAATSYPFYWYDLEKEEETSLEIIPFCVMDVAFKQFAKNNLEDAIRESDKIKEMVRSLEGNFCFVFHNESLSDHRGWEGWHKVFEKWLGK